MRALVTKPLQKNSSALEIIQKFSGNKTELVSSSTPFQCNWKKIHTHTHTYLFIVAFCNIIQQNLLLVFVLISENENDLHQAGNKSKCPFWLVNEILLMYKRHLFTTLIVTLQVDFVWIEIHLFQRETNLFCGIHIKDLNLKINKRNCLPAVGNNTFGNANYGYWLLNHEALPWHT